MGTSMKIPLNGNEGNIYYFLRNPCYVPLLLKAILKQFSQ